MSSDNIKVAVKVRPPIRKEIEERLQPQWTIQGSSIAPVSGYLLSSETYSFDHIFDQSKSNQEMYSSVVKPLVLSALDGFNSTIFAYGQTSSGKTYVMLGSQSVPGIVHLAMNDILEYIERDQERKYLVKCSYIEIYNEKINDLLNVKKGKDLKLREGNDGIPYVSAREEIVSSVTEVLRVMKSGSRARKIGCTDINERSSRSHTIFRITINSMSQAATEGPYKEAHLNLIDLAGSERIAQTKAEGVRLKEGVHINKSLTTLGMVIRRLSEGDLFINYRDSKLTRLLQPALGGNARTLIIATITIAAGEETKSTLEFAFRAKHVKNKPILNEKQSDRQALKQYMKMCKEYEQIIDQMKSESDKKLKIKENIEEKRKLIIQYCGESDINQAELASSIKRRHTLSFLPSSSISILPRIAEVEPLRFSELPEQSRSSDMSFTSVIEDQNDVEDIDDDYTDKSLSDEEYVDAAVQTCSPELDDLLQAIKEGADVNIAQEETPPLASPETTLVETPKSRRSSITPSPIVRKQLKTLEKSFSDLQNFTRLENEMIGSGEFARFNEIKENHDRLREDLINMQTLLSESVKDKELDKLKYEGFIANLREEIQKLQKESRSQGFLLEQLQVEKDQLKTKNNNLENDQKFLLEQLENKYKSRITFLEHEINSLNQNNSDENSLKRQLDVANKEKNILEEKYLDVSTKLKEQEELICEYDERYFDLIKKLETETQLKNQALSEKDELKIELKDSTGFQEEVQGVVDENIGDINVKQVIITKFQKIMARIHMSESLVVAGKRAQNKLRLKNKALRRILKSLKTKTSKIMSQLKKSSKNRKNDLISIIKLINETGSQITNIDNDSDTLSFPKTIPVLKEKLSKSCQKYLEAIVLIISKSQSQQDAKQTQTEFQAQEQECQTDKSSIELSQAGSQTELLYFGSESVSSWESIKMKTKGISTDISTDVKQIQTDCQMQEQQCQTDKSSIKLSQDTGSQTQLLYFGPESESSRESVKIKTEDISCEASTDTKQTQTDCEMQEQESQTDKSSIKLSQDTGSQTQLLYFGPESESSRESIKIKTEDNSCEASTDTKQTQTDCQIQEQECQTQKSSIKLSQDAGSQTKLLYFGPGSKSSLESIKMKTEEFSTDTSIDVKQTQTDCQMQEQECQTQKSSIKLSQEAGSQSKLLHLIPESQSSWESVTTGTEEYPTESTTISTSDFDIPGFEVASLPFTYEEGNILEEFHNLMTKNVQLGQKVKYLTEMNMEAESEMTMLRNTVISLDNELRATKVKIAVFGFKGTSADMLKLFIQKLIALIDKMDTAKSKTATYKQLAEMREDIKKEVEAAYIDIEKVCLELQQAKTERDRSSNELASAQKRLLDADGKVASLTQDLADKCKLASEEESLKEALKEKHTKLNNDFCLLSKEYVIMKETQSTLEEKCSTFEKKCSTFEQKCSTLEDKCSTLEERCKRLDQDNAELRTLQKTLSDQLNIANNKNMKLQLRVEELLQQTAASENEIKNCNKQLSDAKQVQKDFNETLGEIKEKNENLLREKEHLEKKIEDLQTLSERLEAGLQANDSLRIKTQQNLNKKITEQENYITLLKQRLRSMSETVTETDKLQKEIGSLQTKLQEHVTLINVLESTSSNYKQEILALKEKFKTENESWQTQFKEQAGKITNLKNTCSKYEQEIINLEQTKTELTISIQQKQSELIRVLCDASKLEEDVKNLYKKTEEQDILLKKITTEKQKVEEEVQLLKQTNENLNKEITNRREKKQTVEFKLTKTFTLSQSGSVEQSLQRKGSPIITKDPHLSDSQLRPVTPEAGDGKKDDRSSKTDMTSYRRQRRQSFYDQSRSITPECAESTGCDWCVDYILKIEELRKETEELQKQISSLKAKITELDEENDEMANILHTRDAQICTLRESSEKLEHDNKALEKTLRENSMTNVNLKTKIYDLKNELQHKQETFDRRIKTLQQHMEMKITKEFKNQEVQTDKTEDQKIKTLIEEHELKIKRIERKCAHYKYILKCRTEEGQEMRRRLGLTPNEPVLESDIARQSGETSKDAAKK